MVQNPFISRLILSSFKFKTLNFNNPQFNFSLHRHNHALLFSNSFATQQIQPQKDSNFTISYLVTSCGLSLEAAARVSQKVRIENPENPNAVLTVLRNYGFSESQVAKYVQKRPMLLLVKAKKTLLPKLKFFASIGVSPVDLPKIALQNQSLLARSLEKFLIPRYKVLRSVVRSDLEVVRALRRGAMAFIVCDVLNNLVPNIEFLRDFGGVNQDAISAMVMLHPSQSFMKHEKFVEGVKLAKEMGFDPSKMAFISGVYALLHLDKAKLESRFKVMEKWGWSREVSLSAFRKYPTFMSYSEERIDRAMSILVKDMGWLAEDIARFPTTLGYSLERIVARCSVIKVLKSKGLVKDSLSLASFICLRDEAFLESFVERFQQDVPLLPKVYEGSIDYRDVL